MDRRLFLQTTLATGFALGAAGSVGGSDSSGKLILSAPLTHPDWMMRDNVPGVVWGPAGVKHMLDACKSYGWSRIYWRVLDGGRSTRVGW
jgi:hypothetical protein